MNGQVSFVCALINDANYFVAALYDASNLGVVVESQQVPKTGGSYTSPFQVTFLTALTQSKVYRVILWESPDTTPTGVNRVSADFTASTNGVALRGDLYLTGGATAGMNVGASGYVDPTSANEGWVYSLEMVGYGTLQLGVDYTLDGTTNDWTLINGTVIGSGQKFVEHFQAQITQAPPPSVSAISSGQILTEGEAMTSALKNQALYIQSAGDTIAFTLPGLSTLADYDRLSIRCNGGLQINAVFACAGTDKIQYGTRLLTQLILAQGENMMLCKANGVFNIEDPALPGVDRVGEIVHKYSYTEPNLQLADGSVLERAVYPRLYAYMNTLDATAVVSELVWTNTTITQDGLTYSTKKAKWTQGDGSSTFRVPLLFNEFLRVLQPGLRNPGDFQLDAMYAHVHDSLIGNIGGSPNGSGPSKAGGQYGNPRTGITDLSGKPYNAVAAGVAATVVQRVDFENRPINISLYAAIRI